MNKQDNTKKDFADNFCETESDECHMIPEDAALAMEFTLGLICGDTSIAERKKELEEEIRINTRRLDKSSAQKRRVAAKQRGNDRISRSSRAMLNKAISKRQALIDKIRVLRQEYGAVVAVETGIPMNYVLNSRVYTKNNNTHFLLGYYDPEIGEANHGHAVVNGDGKCVYYRLPFEAHGSNNGMRHPVTILEANMQKLSNQPQLG